MARAKTSRRGLASWITQSLTPMFVLDPSRKVLVFNHGCTELTGWEASDVVGLICDYHVDPDSSLIESLTGSICPPPEVMDGAEAFVPVFVHRRDGEPVARTIHYTPLLDAEGKLHRVLGIISERSTRPAASGPSPSQELHAELAAARAELTRKFGLRNLVARSLPMQRVLRQLPLAASGDATVCLIGERGSGRGHIARAIHFAGPQRLRSFVPIACGRLPAREIKRTFAMLWETEPEAQPIERLRPGTVYLDEVDQLPRDLQQLLLEQEGAHRNADGSLKLLAGITRSPDAAVFSEVLLEELAYRLTELTIELPRLQDRREDLPHLAQLLLEELNRDQERQVGGFSGEVLREFEQYHWPGNVAELETVIAEAREACRSTQIQLGDLPFRFRAGRDSQAVSPPVEPDNRPLSEVLEQVEREQIARALQQAAGNKSEAAELLGLTRARLYRRIEALKLE